MKHSKSKWYILNMRTQFFYCTTAQTWFFFLSTDLDDGVIFIWALENRAGKFPLLSSRGINARFRNEHYRTRIWGPTWSRAARRSFSGSWIGTFLSFVHETCGVFLFAFLAGAEGDEFIRALSLLYDVYVMLSGQQLRNQSTHLCTVALPCGLVLRSPR